MTFTLTGCSKTSKRTVNIRNK